VAASQLRLKGVVSPGDCGPGVQAKADCRPANFGGVMSSGPGAGAGVGVEGGPGSGALPVPDPPPSVVGEVAVSRPG
jgi:hypothetical protein